MDCFEIAKYVPDIKILFMGASTCGEAKIANLKNSVGIVSKPVDMERVLAILRDEKI